ncbi:hypothetical protein ABK040_003360 [Willaertia magna]
MSCINKYPFLFLLFFYIFLHVTFCKERTDPVLIKLTNPLFSDFSFCVECDASKQNFLTIPNNLKINSDSNNPFVFYYFLKNPLYSEITISIEQTVQKSWILIIGTEYSRLNIKFKVSKEFPIVKQSLLQNLKGIYINSLLKANFVFEDIDLTTTIPITYYCDEKIEACKGSSIQISGEFWKFDNGGKSIVKELDKRIGFNYTSYFGIEGGGDFKIINSLNDCKSDSTNIIMLIVGLVVILPIGLCCTIICLLTVGTFVFVIFCK